MKTRKPIVTTDTSLENYHVIVILKLCFLCGPLQHFVLSKIYKKSPVLAQCATDKFVYVSQQCPYCLYCYVLSLLRINL